MRTSADLKKGVRLFAGALGTVFLLLIWEIAARALGSEIVLPSPGRVALAAAELFPTERFRVALGATFLRGLSAFGISMAVGAAAGMVSGLSPAVAATLAPALTVIRATPVLAVILLALIWFPTGVVPVFSAVLMAFPIAAEDIRQGVLAADPKLIQMAGIFRLGKLDRLRGVYLPALAPHLTSASHGALGLCWKVVVAGEVLSQPARALGTGLQGARIQLETAEVFAWTSAGIFLCAGTDAAFRVLRKMGKRDAVRTK